MNTWIWLKKVHYFTIDTFHSPSCVISYLEFHVRVMPQCIKRIKLYLYNINARRTRGYAVSYCLVVLHVQY